MVGLSLPLRDYNDRDDDNNYPLCDSTQSIYNETNCIKSYLPYPDDNPCPSDIPCIDQVFQCLPNKHQFITLTPPLFHLYTVGCHFEKPRETAMLEPATQNITSPFGQHKDKGYPPMLVIIAAAVGVICLAVVGCLVRLMIHWVRGSITWASHNHKLPSDGNDHYDDKDKGDYSHSGIDAKCVVDPDVMTSGVTVIKVPVQFSSAHFLSTPRYPSIDSLDYAPRYFHPSLSKD
ncbi:hypothetical protein BGX23_002704 [Mortierella sp. AD031]|nr:hypothetical protein BGX23_002704 [Mortierella sp. AD031]KAG0218356.1 hypothetical protein BGX33_007681 [Mortierella sp. NVP41]